MNQSLCTTQVNFTTYIYSVVSQHICKLKHITRPSNLTILIAIHYKIFMITASLFTMCFTEFARSFLLFSHPWDHWPITSHILSWLYFVSHQFCGTEAGVTVVMHSDSSPQGGLWERSTREAGLSY